MKSIKVMMSVALLAMGIFVLASCGGEHEHNADGSHPEATTVVNHGNGQAYNAAYVCPMHCAGSGAAQAGKCPVCKMDYVAVGDHIKDGHKHKDPHEGHNHGSHDGHNHDHGDHEGHNHD